VLVADMLTESNATDEIELTQYPIETGGTISDHAIRKPRVLELTHPDGNATPGAASRPPARPASVRSLST